MIELILPGFHFTVVHERTQIFLVTVSSLQQAEELASWYSILHPWILEVRESAELRSTWENGWRLSSRSDDQAERPQSSNAVPRQPEGDQNRRVAAGVGEQEAPLLSKTPPPLQADCPVLGVAATGVMAGQGIPSGSFCQFPTHLGRE